MRRVMAGKGQDRFSALSARDLVSVEVAHLKVRFELAEKSVLAERAVALVNAALDGHEREHGIMRAKPGELVVEHQSKKVVLPLLETSYFRRGMASLEARRHHEHDQYSRLRECDPEATYGDLWRMLGREEQNRKRAPKGYDFLPPEPLSDEGLTVLPRNPSDLMRVPSTVMKAVSDILVNEYGCKPGQAQTMVEAIAGIRAWCCPLLEELEPGQVVWLCRGTRKSRRQDPLLFVPVVLTLMAPGEDTQFGHRGELKAVKVRQIERMTTEAWRQDGVLTNFELEWLTGLTQTTIRELLEGYQERFGIILPTAGTVLDMGRTLTHKKIVVEMALSGMTTKEIARRIYHTEEAVDSYLKTFDKILILRHFKLPVSAMARVLGHGQTLINEHLALAEKHFPTPEALSEYLTGRGVALHDTG